MFGTIIRDIGVNESFCGTFGMLLRFTVSSYVVHYPYLCYITLSNDMLCSKFKVSHIYLIKETKKSRYKYPIFMIRSHYSCLL